MIQIKNRLLLLVADRWGGPMNVYYYLSVVGDPQDGAVTLLGLELFGMSSRRKTILLEQSFFSLLSLRYN